MTSGMASIEGAVIVQEGSAPLFHTILSGAPAGQVWTRVWNANNTPATPLVNTFTVAHVWVWGT